MYVYKITRVKICRGSGSELIKSDHGNLTHHTHSHTHAYIHIYTHTHTVTHMINIHAYMHI